MLPNPLQELMTPNEAARWFRRSPSWLRQQRELVRFGQAPRQPLFHVQLCRAYILGRLGGLAGDALRRLQLAALASACGLSADEAAALISSSNP